MSTVNPYAPPKANVDDVSGASSAAEAVRLEHIKHETSVRSIGTLYYIGGFLMLAAGTGLLIAPDSEPLMRPIGGLYVVLGVVSLVVAWGLRRLRRWAGGASIALSAISLLGFPIGTLISAYILYLLLSAKGRRIFEPDYADIIAATPHVKSRTSIVVWILLGVLGLLIAGIVALGMFAG